MARPRHKQLLRDPDVERWFNNLARGSVITAEERLRRLGRFCNATGYTPQTVVDFKWKDPEGFDKFMMDYVDDSLKKGEKPAQVKNNLVTMRSWLGHFGLKIERRIKLPVSDYVDEVVPTKEQLAQLLRHCDTRARAIAALMAFSGLRPESLGNYLGNDGLRLSDLRELEVKKKDGAVEFSKVPTIVVVRKTLSKARHQYFSFLPEEGCQYLKEYLEARLRDGEKLQPDSPLISHTRASSRLSFLRTTKLAWEVKLAIKATGFTWRPYVLRSYCDTAFDIAESKGFISHPWRQFFMGHKGDIEARYSTNKTRLPPDMIEEMRGAYKRCEELLQTSKGEASSEKIKETFKEQLLLVAGFKPEEVEKMDLTQITNEQLQDIVRQRLLGAMVNNGSRQRVINTGEVEHYIQQGWEYVAPLSNDRVILKLPI
ncbi:MAG: site-specific integrase [Nitrososphaerota archaeon]|nr:site-specific integrase [Nitrososphaerota archaeon]MDG6977612.1 site-specific integrase [Nitrososphaerota archaeon]